MDLTEISRAIRSGLKPLEAPEPLLASEWAARHFYLSAESSYVEQRWVAYPFQTAILDCMGHDDIEEVVVRKSARVGYTKMLLAAMGYFAQHKHRNQAIWQPTDEDSDEFVKTELEPMLRDVPVMQQVFPTFMQRHKSNTLRQKMFLGSTLHLRGGKAAKNYRRLTVDVAILDEISGFDLDIEGEGNARKLAAKRLEGATSPKLICGSTPKIKDYCQIEAAESQAELVFHFHVPCPNCGAELPLRWGGEGKPFGFKWIGRDPNTVAHLCEACAALWTQVDYLRVWQRGRWVAPNGVWIAPGCRFLGADGERVPTPRTVGFVLWTGYSPQVDWPKIVREFLDATARAQTGDKAELKTFVNLTLGEVWEEEAEKAEESELKKRAEVYELRTVPRGGLVLVAGVDVQDNRFEIVVWAIGRGEEMWVVDHTVLSANPADERDWERLDAYLQTKFRHAGGGRLGIEAAAIDTSGHFTHQVYNFCRQRARRRIYAVRGDPRYGGPVKGRSSLQDVNYRGQIIKAGVKLWHVGTDTAKDLLFGRFKVTQPGPGCVHFSSGLGDEFYDQITAEQRRLIKVAGGEAYRWVPVRGRPRNEALDCTVYAIFCAHMLDLHRYTDRMWERLEKLVAPPNRDMFAPEEDEAPVPREAPVVQTPALPARGVKRVGRIGSISGGR